MAEVPHQGQQGQQKQKRRCARPRKDVDVTVKYTSFACKRAKVVVKKKNKHTGEWTSATVNLVGRRTRNMHYSTTDKKNDRRVASVRGRILAILALVATLGVWVTIAGFSTQEGAATTMGRRLLFIPRYSWPTAPPGPAGCLLPFRALCTSYGTRYPPDIFTALTGSY